MAMKSELQWINVQQAKEWIAAGEALLLDVREADEYRREHVPGSHHLPLTQFDPRSVPQAEKIIVCCQGGQRAENAAKRLLASGRDEVYPLAGGMDAWKKDQVTSLIVDRKAPISVMRQVQIAAGGLVVLGTVLGAWFPGFLWLSGLVGAGLVFSGATGTCGMAALLARMPWNRPQA